MRPGSLAITFSVFFAVFAASFAAISFYMKNSYLEDTCSVACGETSKQCDTYATCTYTQVIYSLIYNDKNYTVSRTENQDAYVPTQYCDKNLTNCYFDKNRISKTLTLSRGNLLVGPVFGLVIMWVCMVVFLPLVIFYAVKQCLVLKQYSIAKTLEMKTMEK